MVTKIQLTLPIVLIDHPMESLVRHLDFFVDCHYMKFLTFLDSQFVRIIPDVVEAYSWIPETVEGVVSRLHPWIADHRVVATCVDSEDIADPGTSPTPFDLT